MPGAVNVKIAWTRPGGGATAPTITSPAFLVAGTVDTLYPSTTFTATGTAPITWSVTAGTLPTGMSFTTVSNQGVLSGTPTATASGSITFTATNAYGSANTSLTLTVNASGGGGGGTLAGIDVQVAPVVGGVQGSFVTLSSFTQLSSWVDGAYTQDFWRASNVIDDTVFVVSRERGSDRVELWLYRKPYEVFRPRGTGDAYDYSWWTGDAAATAGTTNDKTFDARISVNGSLITPQESASTTTRVLLAPGSIRRLVSGYKSWDWTRVDSAISTRRLPSYDAGSLVPLIQDYSSGYGVPSVAAALAVYSGKTFSHNALGGPNSSDWYDGNFSSGPGGSQLGRALNQTLEACAINDRLNNVSTNLTQIELHLRRSAEYFGAYPQRTNLDPLTLKPYDPQTGSHCWFGAGGISGHTIAPLNNYYMPGRAGYSNWQTTHLYNNGSVAFEATRDPYYALLLQTNLMAALSEVTSSYAAELRFILDFATLDRDNNGGIIKPYPKHCISPNSNRGRWWSLAAVRKAKMAAQFSPVVDFLHDLSYVSSIMTDGIGIYTGKMQDIDAAVLPTQITNQTEADAAHRVMQRSISFYDDLDWDSNPGINPGPPPSGHPKMLSAGTFISSGYAFQSLIYLVSSGETAAQTMLERFARFAANRLIYIGGERSWQGYGSRGSEFPIIPAGNSLYERWTTLPAAFNSPTTWAAYWTANYYLFAEKSNTVMNSNALGQLDYFIDIIQNMRALKVLNDTGAVNVIPSEVNAAMTVFNNQTSLANGYVKGLIDKTWVHRAFMWKP
jgi:hypothetical protein